MRLLIPDLLKIDVGNDLNVYISFLAERLRSIGLNNLSSQKGMLNDQTEIGTEIQC